MENIKERIPSLESVPEAVIDSVPLPTPVLAEINSNNLMLGLHNATMFLAQYKENEND